MRWRPSRAAWSRACCRCSTSSVAARARAAEVPDEEAVTSKRFFWPLYLVLLLGVTLAGTEAIASLVVPSWPARALRPIRVHSSPQVTYNDWALRDRPRTF